MNRTLLACGATVLVTYAFSGVANVVMTLTTNLIPVRITCW